MNKNLNIFPRLTVVAMAIGILTAPVAYPHAGHDKAPGEDDSPQNGPVEISPEAKKNLGITTELVDLKTIETTQMVIGNIEVIPGMAATLSSRISGRVSELLVVENDVVKRDQLLVAVESRLLGNPPPSVKYTAPIDGIIMDRHIVVGDSVEPDSHLLEVADLSFVYAEGRIFEGQIALIRVGQKVRVRVEAYPDESWEGVIDRTGASLDPETRTLRIWVRIPNKDLRLRPHMRSRLFIVTAENTDAVAVPIKAVLGDTGNLFVFIQADTDGLKFERRAVVTGLRDDRYIEIVEGVLPGDEVVTEGSYQLQYVTTRKSDSEKHSEEKPEATSTP